MAARLYRSARWSLSLPSLCSGPRGIRRAWGLPATAQQAGRVEEPAHSPSQVPVTITEIPPSKTDVPVKQPAVEKASQTLYDYYIHTLEDNNFWPLPGSWIDGVDAQTIEVKLAPILQSDPLRVFEQKCNDVKTLQSCLELFVKRHHVSGASRSAVRSEYVRLRPGSRALLWLLQNRESIDLSIHPRLLASLSHCLVAEQSTEDAWQWKSMQYTAPIVSKLPSLSRQVWRSDLLRFLAEAQAYWAKPQNSMEPALRTFFRALDDDESRPPESELYAPKATTGIWILRQLVYRRVQVDTRLYNQFMASLRVFSTNHTYHMDLVRLSLHHPSAPTALPALQLIKQYAGTRNRPEIIRDIFEPKDRRSAAFAFWFLVRTSRQLDQDGYHNEAYWVIDIGRQFMPSLFNGNQKRDYVGMPARPDQARDKDGRRFDKDGKEMTSEKDKIRRQEWDELAKR